MRKLLPITTFVALGLATVASAAGWSDFGAAFEGSPCPDGWVACYVDGQRVDSNLVKDGTGRLVPADLRVGFFDLEGLDTFDQFGSLSQYKGTAPEPEPEPEPAEVAEAGGADTGVEMGGGGEPPPTGEMPSGGSGGGSPAGMGGSQASADAPSGSAGGSGGGVASGGTPAPASSGGSDPAPSGGSSIEAQVGSGGGSAKAEPEKVAAAAAPAGSGDCTNLGKLEPMAMLGKLDAATTKACEEALQAAAKQTDKDKISRVLMTNAYSSGDKASWEKLIKRHLTDIDQSDPDLCYKYALHLSRKGTRAAPSVIKWSNVALENRARWTGNTFVNRVDSLYKLRAVSAAKMWQAAEKAYASDGNDANDKLRTDRRNQTKVMAREWYEYAKSSGKNKDVPLQLCMQAAGTSEYCEGGG